jgi:hypothetical protein
VLGGLSHSRTETRNISPSVLLIGSEEVFPRIDQTWVSFRCYRNIDNNIPRGTVHTLHLFFGIWVPVTVEHVRILFPSSIHKYIWIHSLLVTTRIHPQKRNEHFYLEVGRQNFKRMVGSCRLSNQRLGSLEVQKYTFMYMNIESEF